MDQTFMEIEKRTIDLSEVRLSRDKKTLKGYAVVWNSPSQDLGGFVERFQEGAFDRSLKNRDHQKNPIYLLVSHDSAKVIASTRSGNLKTWSDQRGLAFEASLNDTSYAQDAIAMIESGDIVGMSFGFRSVKDKWTKDSKNRLVTEAQIIEYSPVAFPAYAASSVSVRGNKLYQDKTRVEVGDDRRTLEPFNNFGEQMMAAYKAAHPMYGDIDPRLLNPELRGDDPTGASEKVPSDGGFLVQKDFSDEILQFAHAAGNIASRCRNIPISGNGIKINAVDETSRAEGSRWGGVQSYWKDEGAALEASKPKFRQIELTLNKLTALWYATEELLEDAAAMGAIASQAFGEELAFKIDNEIISGAGTGRPLGILNSNAVVEVSKAGGQAATTYIFDNAISQYSRLLGRSRANAAWYINQDVYPQLFTMSLAVGTGGGPVYLPPGGASASPYGTLMGLPVIPVEQCKTLGTAGDVILADFSQYLLITGGMRSASSIHVRFLQDEVVYKFVTRCDGMPWARSALTPANGSNTQSPFVTVETRS